MSLFIQIVIALCFYGLLFQGNDAYVMSWSFVDRFYPILSSLLLKLFKLSV